MDGVSVYRKMRRSSVERPSKRRALWVTVVSGLAARFAVLGLVLLAVYRR